MEFYQYQSPSLVVASNKKEWFFAQFALLLIFIAGDIFINATNEYESLTNASLNKPSQQLHTLLFLGQIILQFCITSLLCISLFNTFPFQVGVWCHFKTILIWFLTFQPIYLFLSCTIGGMRLSHIKTSGSWFYSTVSFLHVLAAPCYYAASIRTALTLAEKKYYSKDAWLTPTQSQTDSPMKITSSWHILRE